jgi:hypothetical protein
VKSEKTTSRHRDRFFVRTALLRPVDPSPGFDQLSCLLQRLEPIHIQAFVAASSVDQFDEGNVRWLAKSSQQDQVPLQTEDSK